MTCRSAFTVLQQLPFPSGYEGNYGNHHLKQANHLKSGINGQLSIATVKWPSGKSVQWNHAPKQSYIHHWTENIHQGLDSLRYFLADILQIIILDKSTHCIRLGFVSESATLGKPTKWMYVGKKDCFNFNHRFPSLPSGDLRFPPSHEPRSLLAERSRVAPQICPNFQESQRPSDVRNPNTKKTKAIIHGKSHDCTNIIILGDLGWC